MSTPRFIDTSILLYSISRDPEEARKREVAVALLDRDDIALSVQVLQEFYVEVTRDTRRHALPPKVAAILVQTWQRFRVQEITLPLVSNALKISVIHGLSCWDATIVAAARALGCREILSEDLPNGREVEGVTINNPFAEVSV
ncbi:MAG: PIN domain-containing protein [Pseudolabrys sp.]|jgi:predicted nucleic acid-binding protein